MSNIQNIEPLEHPRIVKSHDIHIDTEYTKWIADVKHRYRSAQVKAAVRVNAEKLLFNWQLGRDIVQKKAEKRWGSGVVEQVSLDLNREFPDADEFSVRNLWYMKQWYLFYTQGDVQILHQVGAELESDLNKTDVQWSFKGISTPIGVATYNNIKIKDALPSQEQLAERLRLLQKELQETKKMIRKTNK